MAKRRGEQLRRGDRVLAGQGLVGIPEGTGGEVTMINGFRWIRYWVAFDNGIDRGSIDRSQLTLAKG